MTKTTGERPAAALRGEGDPLFAAIARGFEDDRDVAVGRMFGAAGLAVKGKVFALLVEGRLVAKLPGARVDALVAGGDAERFDPGHGRLMKEWVSLPAGAACARELAREAYRFVKGGAR